jgi:hypothetical protein
MLFYNMNNLFIELFITCGRCLYLNIQRQASGRSVNKDMTNMWQEAVLAQLMCSTEKYAGGGGGGLDKAK